ncbi:PIN domain-containing protein [Candidatus Woesearchaeota archaeon]|nr:PIN domain-containing protein [Candidatus Woesearchaeota archaeon]
MNNIVLDTDIFIDFLRGFEKAKIFFEEIKNEEYLVYFSAVTETELISGKECNKIERKAEILKILANFNKVLVSNEIAIKAGDFSRIHNVETADAIIAATAFAMKAKLITRNADDYKNIREVTLKVPY